MHGGRQCLGASSWGDVQGEGWAGAWVARGVRGVVLKRCADVRAGCLRRVIEARLRAGARAEVDSTCVPSAPSGDRVAYSKLTRSVGRPESLTEMQVLECAGVAEDDIAALAAIPGAPALYWAPPATV